ncbi:S8 family serine peptidase [Tumebacillus permanentifrigoris]|uniref:Subtilase family protein n=1 Tax=Tumebacillus permanentifrigoris TaxID=378543 RepID=A0A316D849_9BACL|nr:S8 family serine peptidase [Tumebacillus permanentifrigoris]PWK12846.1 subtilase family protein [Tumebacillus permanentifrigoris]
MKRSSKWGLITLLTVGLVSPLYWQGSQPAPIRKQVSPAPTPQATPHVTQTHDAHRAAVVQALRAKKGRGNEAVVARDIASTAALCVRDCRTMLTMISNELSHATTAEERRRILENHMKQHTQFVSLTYTHDGGAPVQLGTPLNPSLHPQAQAYAKRDEFYVSDLYHKPQQKDPQEQIGMTLAVPVLDTTKVHGALTADIEMGHLMSVIKNQDDEMGTRTQILGANGQNEALPYKTSDTFGGTTTKQVSTKSAQSKVDGTAWSVHSLSLQDQGRKHIQTVQDEVLVRFDRDLSPAEIQTMTTDIGGELVKNTARHGYVFRSARKSPADMIAYFKQKGAVIAERHSRARKNDDGESASSDRVVEQPNDTFYSSNQWNLPLIKADKAWQMTTGDPGVIIAVVDTGVDLDHPDLKGKLVAGRNIIAGNDQPQDDNGHGTHCAGIIAARTNNLEGIAGVDWNSKIMPVKAMAADGTGSVADIADGVVWAADHGANVINLSLGDYEDSDYLHEAIKYAYDKGVVVTAAMGNDGSGEPSYPAAYPEVIGVAANDENNETATFSNFGGHCSVSAPGVAIPSTYPNRRYVALSGTSMASPHVAGVAGLVKSINKDLKPDDVRRILEKTADDLGPEGKDEYFGNGEINVSRAVTEAKASLTTSK